ncbi:hypothetical protein GPECTOR_36g79 [Gonium pectorale]|uniref:Uncharacterized protein n=1 Tax=Gonium pectorale TaxID=33097 RepID=A0A150GBX6_GONPE|nr:hypothetical protein GPECTOR_36g79 [Gonium pectorale]|eukprot:KXZ47356.1 hypothetical protein GPECTOR_36g79 [Gonium pectorale]
MLLRLASLPAALEREVAEWRSGAADGGGGAVREAAAVATDVSARRCEQAAAAAAEDEDERVSRRGIRDHREVEGLEEEGEEEGEEASWGPTEGIGEPARDEEREEREGVTLPGDAQSESEVDSSAWKRGRAVEAGASAAIEARSSSAWASNMSLV